MMKQVCIRPAFDCGQKNPDLTLGLIQERAHTYLRRLPVLHISGIFSDLERKKAHNLSLKLIQEIFLHPPYRIMSHKKKPLKSKKRYLMD